MGVRAPLIYLKWLGRHVTLVYVLQWLIIGNVGTAIYKTQSLSELMVWWPLILAVASAGVFVVNRMKQASSSTAD